MPTKTPAKKSTAVKAAPTKPAAKAVAKKAAPKKKAAKKPSCACGACCAAEQSFWVNNGPVIDSLKGLSEAVKGMSDEQYAYHTERDGNDFARWIRDCLGNTSLASRVAKAKTRSSAARALATACSCR